MHYPFKVIPLPYSYSSLEPQLCSDILLYHHDKHYEKYVLNINNILAKYPSMQTLSLEELIIYTEKIELSSKNEILVNAGGVYNHQLYFKCITPNHTCTPTGKLSYAIKKDFGSFNNFTNVFSKYANSFVGSGYTWLIDNYGRLEIMNTSNQDTPLSYNVTPLLNLDLWEHSYYLQYKNNRAQYIENWFNIINWAYIEKRYLATL